MNNNLKTEIKTLVVSLLCESKERNWVKE